MNNQIMLTISILMSGRKETRKCLDSIKSILEQVPSELILIDTGCDEKTRDILYEYTDNIIPFEWCNDFSKARNVGLERAKGKWFMYMDDDEWFEDVSEIVEFFNSGEHNKYNSASYIVRNYFTPDEKKYNDSKVGRMVKIEKGTRFINKIHESLYPLRTPTKVFDAYVKHFGYMFKSVKELYHHSKRNLSLIKKEVEKNPEDIRMFLQMLQEYKRLGEYGNIVDLALKKIEYLLNIDRNCSSKDGFNIGYIYAYILDAYEITYDYNSAISIIEQIKLDEYKNELFKAFCYKTQLISYFELKDYSKALTAFLNYISVYNEINNDKDKMFLYGGFILDSALRKENYNIALCYGMMIALKLKKEKVFKKYYKILDLDELSDDISRKLFTNLIEYILDNDCKEDYIIYVNTLLKNYMFESIFISKIKKLEEMVNNEEKEVASLDNHIDIDIEKKYDRALNICSKVDSKHWYINYIKILNYENDKDVEKCLNNFQVLFEHVVDIFNLNNEIWRIAEGINIDFDACIKKISFDRWQEGISNWLCFASKDDIEYKESLINRLKNSDDYRYLYFDMKIKEGKLRTIDKNDIEYEQLEEMIFDFANTCYKYCIKIYNENVIKQHTDVLPKECYLAIKLMEIEDYRKNRDYKAIINVIKECVSIYEPFNDILKEYVKKIGEYIDKQNHNIDEDDISIELTELTSKLKLKVRKFIENGNIVEARVVLNQIIQCVPEDKEAKEILNMISE